MTSHSFQGFVTFDDFYNLMHGKPYGDRCCHVDTVDCWGLIVLFYRMCRGVNIHHDDSYDNGGSFSTCFDGEIDFWIDTKTPEPGDVVIAYRGAFPVHVALLWGRDKILHARDKTYVRIDRLSTLERLSTKIRVVKYASNTCSEVAGDT